MTFFSHLVKTYLWQIVFAALIFGGLTLTATVKPELHKDIAWSEAIAGFGTLLFAFLIWLNNLKQSWINDLSKRISVFYRFNGRIVMMCKDSVLTNESDARTWALQIGQQMSGCQRLKFSPFFNFQDKGVQTNTATKESFRSYIFTYYLTELPTPDSGTDEEKRQAKQTLEQGCIEFTPRFHQDGSINYEKGFYPASQTMNVTN